MAELYKTSADAGAEVRSSGQTGIAPAPQNSTGVLAENKPRGGIAVPQRASVDPAFDAYLAETRSPQRQEATSTDPAFDAYLAGKVTLDQVGQPDPSMPSQEPTKEVGFMDSVEKGFKGVKLTWDFLANKLERAVTGDGSTTAPILQKSVDEYKALASDPRIQEVIQLGNDAPGYYEGAKAMLKYAAQNPGMVVNFLGEQLPAMVGGGVIGKTVQGVAKGAALKAGTSAATAGAVGMGTFGAATNSTAVVLGSLGTNYVQGLDKFNGDKDAAADYASTKTLAEVPANAVAGMFMGVNPMSRFATKAPIASTVGNVAFQANVQGLGGALGAYQAGQAVGEDVGRGELLAEYLGEAAFAPAEVLTSGGIRRPAKPAPTPQGSVTVEQAPERFNNAPAIPTMGESTLAPVPQGLTNEEFFGMAQARQTPAILSALYANADEGTKRQLQTYANKTGMKLDLENASKNQTLVDKGNQFVEGNPIFVGMFQERLGEFYERTRPKDMPQEPVKTPPKDTTPFVERKRLDDTLAQQEQAIAEAQAEERKPGVQSNVTPAPTQIGVDPTQSGNVSQNVQNSEVNTPIPSEPGPLAQLNQAEVRVRQGLPVDTQEAVSEKTPAQGKTNQTSSQGTPTEQRIQTAATPSNVSVSEAVPQAQTVQQDAVQEVKKKRRTKAEIEAEKQAQKSIAKAADFRAMTENAAQETKSTVDYETVAKNLPKSKKLLDEANLLRGTEQMTIEERDAAQAAINKYEFGKAEKLIKEAKKRPKKFTKEEETPFEPPELIDERLRNFQFARDAKPIARDVVEQDMMRAQAEFNRAERAAEFEKEGFTDGKAAVLINRLTEKNDKKKPRSNRTAQDIRPVAELLNKSGDVVGRIYGTRNSGFFQFMATEGALTRGPKPEDGAAPENFNQIPSRAATLGAFTKKTKYQVRTIERPPVPIQKELSFTPEKQKQLNKFDADAQRIMTTMFTGSTVKDTLNELRAALKGASKAQQNFFKYNKKRSDDEYIFTLFEGSGAIPTGPVINTDLGGMSEIGDNKKRGGSSSPTAKLAAAIQSAQEGDIKARAGLMKVHLEKILDELEGVRQKMQEAGFDKETIDRIVSEKEDSIKAIQETETPAEYKYEKNPSQFLSALDEFNEVVDEEVTPESFDLPFPDIERSDRIQAAINAIKEIGETGDLKVYYNEMSKPRAEREFQFSDFRAAAKKLGFDLSLVDVDVSQKPAFHTRLADFVYANPKGLEGNYLARDQWVSSYNQIKYLLEDRPEQLNAFEKTITPNERRIIDYVNEQRKDLGGRIEGVLKEKGEFFADAKDAFPSALFNRFRLDEMRPSKIPDNYREALRSIVGGNEDLLYSRWLADVYDAINARRDLQGQIMSRLTEKEQSEVTRFFKKVDGNVAKNLKASERATFSAQLDTLAFLPKKAYDNFKQAIGTSEIKDLPKILQRAREVDELKRLSKNKQEFSDAMAALLGQVYHNDSMSSFPLDQILDRVEVMNKEELPQVSDEEIRAYQDRLARQGEDFMAVDDIKQAILFEKLAQEAAQPDEKFVPEQAADSSTQPETQARLGGDISYKRGVNSNGPGATQVYAHLAEATYDWPIQPDYEVYYHVGQIPDPALRERILSRSPTGDIKGAIDPETGKVYLFSQRLQSMEDAEFVLFHELYGHWGLRYFLGDKIDSFLNNQYKLNQKVRDEADKQFNEALETSTPMSRVESIEEAIADMAARGDTKLFKEIIGRLVAWLREHDMKAVADWLDSKGEAELAYVLSEARKAVRTQQGISPLNGAPSEVLYARNKQPVELYAQRNEEVTGYARLNPVLGEWVVYTKNDKGEWGYILMENYENVFSTLKEVGSLSRSRERETRKQVDPNQFIRIPDFEDVSGWNKFVRKLTFEAQNQYLPIFEVAEYMSKNGADNTVIRDLKLYESRLKYLVDQMKKDYEQPIQKLLKAIGDKGGDMQKVDRFLAARHAEERNDYIDKITEGNNKIGSGYSKRARMVDGETIPGYLDILDEAKTLPFSEELNQLGALMDKLSDDHVNYMVQSELIPEAEGARLKRYKHYVNLSGNKKLKLDAYDDTVLEGNGFNFKGREIRGATGRGTEAVDVLANTLNSYMSTLIRGQKAIINRSIATMFEELGADPSYVQIEPIKEKKKLNLDRMITDNVILRAIGDKATEASGRQYLKDLKKRVDAGMTSDEAAQLELIARINEAETMMILDPNVAKTARLRVDASMINAGSLSPDGYVSLVEDPSLIKDKNVVVARFNGKPVLLSFDKRATAFVQALSGASQQQRGDLTEAVGAWGRMFGQMLTSWNPAWVIPNGARDFQTAIANMSTDPNVGPAIAQRIKNEWGPAYVLAFREHIIENAEETGGWTGKYMKSKKEKTSLTPEQAELIDAFKKYGGETFFMDRKSLKDTLEELNMHMFGPQNNRQKFEKKVEGAKKLMELLNIPMETAPRLATFKILREEFFKKNIDKGMTEAEAREEANIEAALYAKEVTVNFNMKGNSRALRALYVFFNPAVQGTVRMFKNYSRGDEGVARFLPSNSFAKVGGAFIAIGFLGNFLARGLGGEDEDKPGVDKLDQIPEYKRGTSLIIAPDMPGAAIPIAYGWNVFYAMGHYMADVVLNKLKVEEAANRVLKVAFDAFAPLGSGSESKTVSGTIMDTMLPTILQAPSDLASNENRFGAPIFKSQSQFSNVKEADSWMHFDTVNPISKFIMHGLNDVTGGNRYKSGLIDVNPAAVDYVISAYLPGLVNELYKGAGLIIRAGRGEDIKRTPLPIIDRISAIIPQNYDAGAVRRVSEQVDTLYAEYMSPQTSQARRQEIVKDHPGLGKIKALVSGIDQDVKKLNQQLKTINESDRPDSYKVEAQNRIKKQQDALYKRAVRLSIEGGFKDAVIGNATNNNVLNKSGEMLRKRDED